MSKELDIILEIIKQAWEIVLKYHWWSELNTKYKIDKFDPVTQADLEADKFIRAKIEENFPNDKILSEETENNLPDFTGRVWMVDPLDWTKDFVWAGERYSIMIWLCVDWQLELWVVYCPTIWDLYYAEKWNWAFFSNKKKQQNLQKIEVSKIDKIEEANYFTKSKFSEKRGTNEKIEEIFHFKKILDWWSVGIVLWEIGRWIADCYILTNEKACKRDSCGPQIILQEAWWKVTDVFWNEIDYLNWTKKLSNLLVATNGKFHEKIIEKTKEIFKKE